MVKFDCIIGNPPFKKDLHLKILNRVVNICNHLLFVHPSAWLIKQTPRSKTEQQTVNIVKNNHSTFTFIKGLYYFGVHQYTPCSITNISINKLPNGIVINDQTKNRTLNFNSVDDVNCISDSAEYFKLRKRIIKMSNDNVSSYIKRPGKYYITLPKVRGSSAGRKEHKDGILCKDFYTMIARNTEPTTEPTGDLFIGFDTKEEANNFISYIKTDFARFCLALLKFDANIHPTKLKYVPWLDFTQSWADTKLYKEFYIDSNIIEETIEEFYSQ